jgi:hypothetical protein
MTTLVEASREMERSVPHAAPSVLYSASLVKRSIADVWPTVIVAFGLGLSVVWTAGLFWLLYVLV